MLDALLRRQETDMLLVQEVTYHVPNDFQGYTTQYNIGAKMRSPDASADLSTPHCTVWHWH